MSLLNCFCVVTVFNRKPLSTLEAHVCFYLCIVMCHNEEKFLIYVVRMQLKLFHCMKEQLMTHFIQLSNIEVHPLIFPIITYLLLLFNSHFFIKY